MNEPAVTLTDYALALECAVLAVLILRTEGGEEDLRRPFALFFAAAGAGPLLGGTVHGFFPDAASLGHDLLWRGALLSIGATAALGARLALRLLVGALRSRRATTWIAALFAAYAVAVAAGLDDFAVAIVAYLPAALLLMLAFARVARSRGEPRIARGAWGLGVTFVAAGVQQAGLGIHPVYFDHNAVYHVIQAGALLLIFAGARALVRTGRSREVRAC